MEEEVLILKDELVLADSLRVLEQSKYEVSQKINEDLQLSLKQYKRKSITTFIGVGVGGTLLGVLFGMLLNNN